MSGIICAIRGGPESQPTIEKAIDLAKEVNRPLYFLYIVNLDFLTYTESSKTRTISEQLVQMGEFILLAAQEKAADQSVDAQAVIRHGKVRSEIIAAAHELSANYIILGHPVGDLDNNEFLLERLREFAENIEKETGADVIVAGGPIQE